MSAGVEARQNTKWRRITCTCLVVLALTILVILGGAFVRATMSGAGCGDEWPMCKGTVVPTLTIRETLIEWMHRITSGLAWLGTLALVILTRRSRTKDDDVTWKSSSPLASEGLQASGELQASNLALSALRTSAERTRIYAIWSFVFMCTEALIGAGLVLLRLVANDTSSARAIWVSAHLFNTFLLLGALLFCTTAAWQTWRYARGRQGMPRYSSVELKPMTRKALALLGALCVAVFLLVGVSGALTALGDTLFPSRTLAEGMEQDVMPGAHFLLRLRVWHPVLAIGSSLVLMLGSIAFVQLGLRAARREGDRGSVVRTAALGLSLPFLLVVQTLSGFGNLLLLTPVWLQLTHLLLADLMWLAVLLIARGLTAPLWQAPGQRFLLIDRFRKKGPQLLGAAADNLGS